MWFGGGKCSPADLCEDTGVVVGEGVPLPFCAGDWGNALRHWEGAGVAGESVPLPFCADNWRNTLHH